MGEATFKLAPLRAMLPASLGERLEPHARVVGAAPGEMVLSFGARSTEVYLILDGHVRAQLYSPGGHEVILGDLGPGDIFGEVAAIDAAPRTATVAAVSECRFARIPGAIFREAVLGDPAAAEWLAMQLMARIRLLTERIFELNTLAVRDRLHCELLRLCLDAGIEANRAVIEDAPTHSEIAARIGTHREAVTRELQSLARRGIVTQQRRRLAVSDVLALARIVRAAAGDVELIQQVVGTVRE
ncbi:Crp/Fnr family transcriptional regulator [Sphingosinicella humi]|nr:Crp/Fnr family transcriptional regulator [Sphingosinicella humi]